MHISKLLLFEHHKIEGKAPVIGGFPPIMQSFDGLYFDDVNNFLPQQLSWQWYHTT